MTQPRPVATSPPDRRQIRDGVFGWLEGPADGADSPTEFISVSGWMLQGPTVEEIWVQLGGRRQPLSYGYERPDVAITYPRDPEAVRSRRT